MRPVVLRARAARDVDEALEWYSTEADSSVALRFVDAVERALGRVAHYPGSGSSRYAQELDIPGLRVAAVSGFPYLVFYVETTSHVEVWRVLHGERDLPAMLSVE